MAKTYYTEEHEWVKVIEGNTVRIGITEHAQEQLGDIVFIDFTSDLAEVAKGDDIVTVESVKSVSDVYAPVAGVITKQNGVLNDAPETVNTSATDEGWMVEMEVADLAELEELMDEAAYAAFVAEEEN